jgi:hypothetical protein
MAYTNAGGELDESGAAAMGIEINTGLRDFNARDGYRHKVVALMGDLGRRGARFNIVKPRTMMSYIAAPLAPAFSSLDPLVHFESGVGAGLPFGAVRTFRGLDHDAMMRDRDALAAAYEELGSSAARGR